MFKLFIGNNKFIEMSNSIKILFQNLFQIILTLATRIQSHIFRSACILWLLVSIFSFNFLILMFSLKSSNNKPKKNLENNKLSTLNTCLLLVWFYDKCSYLIRTEWDEKENYRLWVVHLILPHTNTTPAFGPLK